MTSKPFLSAHKFIEYCYASPVKRKSIIYNALSPERYLLDTGYKDIERAAVHMLAEGFDFSRLNALDSALLLRSPKTDHEEQRLLTAHDAIEFCKQMRWTLPDGIRVFSGVDFNGKLTIGALTLSFGNYAVINRSQLGNKTKAIGIVKPYLGKGFALSDTKNHDRGALFAALVHWFVERELAHLGEADTRLCHVADVFRMKLHRAPDRFAQRRKLMIASAEEITDRWPAIAQRLAADSAAMTSHDS